MAPPRRAPPELTDKLVERVLLHIPPTDPAGLLRAALVCKRWGRLTFSRRFRSRYRDFHGGDAMVGLLCNLEDADGKYVSRFVPTPPPSGPPRADLRGWRALDARHGRVLLRDLVWGSYLDVWDPFTGERRQLTATPPIQDRWSWNAAVLCAQYDACDHLVCRGGPFLVVVLGANDAHSMSVCFYSSDTARWSTPRRLARLPEHGVDVVPPVLIGNALYFGIDLGSFTTSGPAAPDVDGVVEAAGGGELGEQSPPPVAGNEALEAVGEELEAGVDDDNLDADHDEDAPLRRDLAGDVRVVSPGEVSNRQERSQHCERPLLVRHQMVLQVLEKFKMMEEVHFEPWERMKTWAPGKCRFLTADRLAKQNLPHPANCPLCDREAKTVDHLLAGCVFARQFWVDTRVSSSTRSGLNLATALVMAGEETWLWSMAGAKDLSLLTGHDLVEVINYSYLRLAWSPRVAECGIHWIDNN
ncbi:hypothetical protein PR202_ga28544 [Eleusine coracana subsp. coracana]|uniref:F-box domain-containing protein n=1 Tax=Eleusine coracana subsp. coracana TaxID=191504 RepID=A0AAV5DKL7_ELECO|nr:hypothetical protein PR202_ga28544 [Eleusine coracana subsp. coracana]